MKWTSIISMPFSITVPTTLAVLQPSIRNVPPALSAARSSLISTDTSTRIQQRAILPISRSIAYVR